MSLLSVTYSARSWVGDLPRVRHPLVVGPLLVGEGPVEDHADVGHGVHAHRRAFKDGAGGENAGRQINSLSWDNDCGCLSVAATIYFLPTYSAGLLEELKHSDTHTHTLRATGTEWSCLIHWHTNTHGLQRVAGARAAARWVLHVCYACHGPLSLAPHVFLSAGLKMCLMPEDRKEPGTIFVSQIH